MQLTSVNDITTTHRHIFLSPHFDDAVYSCGGTLGVQVSVGLHPLVITIFGGVPDAQLELSPLAGSIHRKMGFYGKPSEAVEARRQEDAAAMDFLRVDYLWLNYQDAIYRGTPAYYTQENQLFGSDVHPGDMWIDKELAELLVSLQERLPDAVWYAPLAIGRHVDHQIVCSAADRLIQRGANVKLYEDFPYVLRPNSLQTRLTEFGGTLEPALVEMSEMVRLRQEAADLYASQIEINFADQKDMHRSIENYAHSIRPVETVHLERYWTAG